jgi:hypothetical protein
MPRRVLQCRALECPATPDHTSPRTSDIGPEDFSCKKKFQGKRKFLHHANIADYRERCHKQPMTGKQFDEILKELGLTRETAGKALGLSGRSVAAHANRKGTVPRRIELAVKGLLAERQAAAVKR